MKILITGATGFIGNHLIKELLKNTNYTIIASSRDTEKVKKYEWFSKVKYISYNLDSDKKQNLFEFFDNPDIVIHLAWDGLPNYNDLIHIEKNLFNSYKFIKNLVANGLKNITITGTCFEYGMINGCLSEDIQTNPSNSYAIAKDSLRKFIEELKNNYKFNYKWVRLFYMYGEGQGEKSLIALLDKAMQNDEKEFNMSGGEQLRDYLYIKEVVSNISKIALQNKIDNQIINCCSGKPISIRKFVEDYLDEKNYSIKLNLGYYPYQTYEPMAFWGDNTKIDLIKKEKDES
ncbi:NAD-dependent epimerase/dehydratase family protein [Aliarcobacter skirrowii]|uniref:NAD-dependent epimerase/dehydratase family protein n=1 Tax=Aliarcobacter skirrowii TaxID=28200 RepID=UPI0029A26D44|nr:NAD-dependent epimerase/dehydratase family protein [Aliarcobacter skirrowii]MDX4058517.1 NAD-dependent epimerase/dehydratase family protein [Aliarcobacter skirrowii]